MNNRFPVVYTGTNSPHCNFCGSVWGVDATLDTRFGHTDAQAREYGWLYCCGQCWARVMYAAYSNRPDQKPRNYQGYRPIKERIRWDS